MIAAQGARLVSMIAAYTAHASAGKVLIRDEVDRLRYFVENVSRWCKSGMDILHFSIERRGFEKLDLKNRNYLFVANHLSYVDVLVFSSQIPSVFVTSVDMGEVFFLGTMAELGGSIFVERRHRNQVDRDLSKMTKTLEQGFNIVIFPEGTSTDGSQVLPFKKSLLMSAVDSGRDIVPVAIKYLTVDGESFGPGNCNKIAWHGDMTFADHFIGLLKLREVRVVVDFLEPIQVGNETSRTELAERSWSAIQESYFADRPATFTERFGKRRSTMALLEPRPRGTP